MLSVCIALCVASAVAVVPQMPLSYVPGMYPRFQLSKTGRYEHKVDHHDIFGGHTFMDSTAHWKQDAFINLDDAASETTLVSCQNNKIIVDAAKMPTIGGILLGTSMTHCCDGAMDAEILNGAGVCMRRVTRVAKLTSGSESAADGVERFIVDSAEVDMMSIVERMSIKFRHQPGNRTMEEAHAEARKRGTLIDVGTQQSFEAFNWNMDVPRQEAKDKDIAISTPGGLLGITATCSECFLRLELGVEFELLIESTWYWMPVPKHFRLVFTGTVDSSSVVKWSIPVAIEAFSNSWNLIPEIEGRPFLIPTPGAFFSLTATPVFGTRLNLEFEASFQLDLQTGKKVRTSVSFGAQWSAGSGAPQLIGQVSRDVVYPEALVPVEAQSMTATVEFSILAELGIDMGIGLTATAIAGQPGVTFLGFGVAYGPAVQFSVSPDDSCSASGSLLSRAKYEFAEGVRLETEMTLIEFELGPITINIGTESGLPFAWFWEPNAPAVPEGCEVCSGCVSNVRLPAFSLPFERVGQVPASNRPETEEPLTVTTRQELYEIGERFDVDWKLNTGDYKPRWGAQAQVVFEKRTNQDEQGTAAYPEMYSSVYSEEVRFRNAHYRFTAGPPFVNLVDGDQIRITVAALDVDFVYGRSDWIPIKLPPPPTRVTGHLLVKTWTPCVAKCGVGIMQTREYVCVDALSRPIAEENCSRLMRLLPELERPCPDLQPCRYLPFNFQEPRTEQVLTSPDFTFDVDVSVAGGGYDIRAVLQFCVDGAESVTCATPLLTELNCKTLQELPEPQTPGRQINMNVRLRLNELSGMRFDDGHVRSLRGRFVVLYTAPDTQEVKLDFSPVLTLRYFTGYQLTTASNFPLVNFGIAGEVGTIGYVPSTRGKDPSARLSHHPPEAIVPQERVLDVGDIYAVFIRKTSVNMPQVTLTIAQQAPFAGVQIPLELLDYDDYYYFAHCYRLSCHKDALSDALDDIIDLPFAGQRCRNANLQSDLALAYASAVSQLSTDGKFRNDGGMLGVGSGTGMSAGAIAGVAIAAFCCCMLLVGGVFGVFFLLQRRRATAAPPALTMGATDDAMMSARVSAGTVSAGSAAPFSAGSAAPFSVGSAAPFSAGSAAPFSAGSAASFSAAAIAAPGAFMCAQCGASYGTPEDLAHHKQKRGH